MDNTSISAIVSDTNDKSGRLFVDKFKFVKYDEIHLNQLWKQYHSTLFASGNTFKIINEDTTDLEFAIYINKYFTVYGKDKVRGG